MGNATTGKPRPLQRSFVPASFAMQPLLDLWMSVTNQETAGFQKLRGSKHMELLDEDSGHIVPGAHVEVTARNIRGVVTGVDKHSVWLRDSQRFVRRFRRCEVHCIEDSVQRAGSQR